MATARPNAVAYEIVNGNSGKCAEVYHSQLGDGANVDQFTCNGTYTQYWIPVQVGTYNGYSVDELVNGNSGKCAEVYHSQLGDGANVDQWTCNSTYTQYWIDDTVAIPGYDVFVNYNSGLVMEVYHSSTADYGNVDQWAFNGTYTQSWY